MTLQKDILFLLLSACVKDMGSSFVIWVGPHTEDCGNPQAVEGLCIHVELPPKKSWLHFVL